MQKGRIIHNCLSPDLRLCDIVSQKMTHSRTRQRPNPRSQMLLQSISPDICSQRPDVRLRDCNAVVFGKAVESAPKSMFLGIRFAGRAQPALVGMGTPLIDSHGFGCRRDIRFVQRDSPGIVDNFVKRLERLGSRRRRFLRLFFLWRPSFDRHDDARGYSPSSSSPSSTTSSQLANSSPRGPSFISSTVAMILSAARHLLVALQVLASAQHGCS